MKIAKLLILVMFLFSVTEYGCSFALAQQDDEYSREEEPEERQSRSGSIKNIFANFSYGSPGFGTGLGFRWTYIGASISAAGFANPIPNSTYWTAKDFPNTSAPKQEERFTYILVNFDLIGYWDFDNMSLFDYPIDDFSLFATIGYFSQQDSILLKGNEPGKTTHDKYFHKQSGLSAETINEFSYGLGVQYRVLSYMNLALGYQNKFGIYLQLGYWWR